MTASAQHQKPGISARVLGRLADFVAARGHDPEALCRSEGLTLGVLRDAEARVPCEVAERLGERAAAWTGDANLGLHLAQDVRDPAQLDAGTLMLMACPSIRTALEALANYQRFWGDGERCRLTPAEAGLCVRYVLPGAALPLARRHSDECALAEIVLGLRAFSGRALSPRVVRFRHAAPPDTSEHASLFACRLEFSTRHTELEFDDAVLETPMANANEAYFEIFRGQVERALAHLPGQSGATERVRRAARAALAGGRCTLSGTARLLGVSARTLQRRLQAEDTSFAALVDALRRELSLAYLERELPIAQIAWQLGYADATAFHRAFRRWTGRTPEQARRASGRG